MFFLIRCVFWLTVVFTTIFNTNHLTPPNGAEAGPHNAVALKQDAAASATTAVLSEKIQNWSTLALHYAWSETTGGCAAANGQCASLAERLAAFARQHPFKEAAKSESDGKPPQVGRLPGSEPGADIPLPPRRPRFGYDHMARN